jgi:uncharacterized repeat protein (TIGR01451 family)
LCQVVLDAAGNIYLGGFTTSPDFATTPAAAFGMPQTGGGSQMFVRKLSPDGSKLLYSTYLGGAVFNAGHPLGLRVDGSGNAYVAANIFDDTQAGSGPAITPNGVVGVYKLSPGGDQLVYRTRVLPSFNYTASVGLAIDHSGALADIALGMDGSIYLAGSTQGGGLTTTAGALQPSATPQAQHGFVIRMKPDGSAPIYSTYIAGNFIDSVGALAVDASGAAYVGGQTLSQGTQTALAGTPLGLSAALATSGFVLKLDPTGSRALYSALLPSSSVYALALDAAGNVYAGGETSLELTASKIDPTGTRLLYHSVIPAPTPGDYAIGIAADAAGNAYLAGSVLSVAIPDTVQASRLLPNGALLKIDANPAQCDLSVQVQPIAAFVPGSTVPLTFTIRNNGPAAAQSVVFSGLLQGGAASSCSATGSGVCATNSQLIKVTFDSIPAGGMQSVELILISSLGPTESVSMNAAVTTVTSDVNQDNNYAPVSNPGSFVVLTLSPSVRAQCTFTSPVSFSICGGGAVYAPPNSQVQIFWPSPQAIPGAVVAFKNWGDGSTDNPRMFNSSAPLGLLSAVFTFLGSPYLAAASVTNSGSYGAGGVSPGELVTLFGFNFGAGPVQVQNGRFPTNAGSTTVSFDGFAAPLVYVSGTQINAIVPYEIAGQSSTNITVRTGSAAFSVATVPVVPAAPALFTANGSGMDQAAALNQDLSVNSPANPANPGDVIVLYGTGAGLVSSPRPGNLWVIPGANEGPDVHRSAYSRWFQRCHRYL